MTDSHSFQQYFAVFFTLLLSTHPTNSFQVLFHQYSKGSPCSSYSFRYPYGDRIMFTPTPHLPTHPTYFESFTALAMGTNRQTRRNQKKEQAGQSRPSSFYDAVKEAQGQQQQQTNEENESAASNNVPIGKMSKDMSPPKSNVQLEESGQRLSSKLGGEGESVVSGASISDASVARMNARPDVSTIIVDEETGIERIQQGKYVMDVVTRKAVKLSDVGPMVRLAQMFPGVAPTIRQQHRIQNWMQVQVPQLVQSLKEACYITSTTSGIIGDIPPHPQFSNTALDFVLSNYDLLGYRMKKTLGRMKLRAQSLGKKEEAIELRKLWKHFITLQDHISAPFRQMLMDAEGKVGPNFGNLDLNSYCKGELYERTACYLVLKGMVAHWEKKVRDAEYVESTPQSRDNFLDILMVGDPKRYLPDPPIIFRYDEVVRIALMAQNMTARFVNTPELFNDLPPEVRFIEKASFIKGGTALRKFMIDEFCPAEGLTPEALREGVRRLEIQMDCMQIDPYGDLRNVISRLLEACSTGTEDEYDPYIPYLANFDKDGPGYFTTYTMDYDRQSLVRFLDMAKEIQQGTIGPTDNLADQLAREAANLFGFKSSSPTRSNADQKITKETLYKTPEDRAAGRPHNLGWLDLLGDEELYGEKSSGKTSSETFESDNWREVIVKKQGSQRS